MPELKPDELHVWIADLDNAPSLLREHLSSTETAKASRFVRPEDRVRYAAAHGILRQLLGSYLGMAPSQIEFECNSFGKPALASKDASSGICLNLSHSAHLGLFGFVRNRELGVDLERVRPQVANEDIARRFFAPGESTRLLSLPPDERVSAFFECWTRKEAYVKARGDGLSRQLDSFEVSFGSGVKPELLVTAEGAIEAKRWLMLDLDPGPDFRAAVVVEGPDLRLVRLRFAGSCVG